MFSQLKDRINNSLNQIQQQQQAQAQQQSPDKSNASRSGSPAPSSPSLKPTGSPSRAGRNDASTPQRTSQESQPQIRHHATPSLEGVLSSVRRSLQSSKISQVQTTPTAAEAQTQAHVEAAAKESDRDPVDIIEEIEAEIQREREEDQRRQKEAVSNNDDAAESLKSKTSLTSSTNKVETEIELPSREEVAEPSVSDLKTEGLVDNQSEGFKESPTPFEVIASESTATIQEGKAIPEAAEQTTSATATPQHPTIDESEISKQAPTSNEAPKSSSHQKSSSISEPTKSIPSPPPPTPAKDNAMPKATQERLDRLSKYEKRFPELARAYKKLAAEKKAVEAVLQKSTPIESISDVDAFEGHLNNLTVRAEMSINEIRRVTTLLDENKRQTEELREIHKMESKSQSEQIDELKAKVEALEAELKTVRNEAAQNQQPSEAKIKALEEEWQLKLKSAEEEYARKLSTMEANSLASKSEGTTNSSSAADDFQVQVPSNDIPKEAVSAASAPNATITQASSEDATLEAKSMANGDASISSDADVDATEAASVSTVPQASSENVKEIAEQNLRLHKELATANGKIANLEQKIKTAEIEYSNLKSLHNTTTASESEALASLASLREKLSHGEKAQSELSGQLASSRQNLIAKDAEAEKVKRQLTEEEEKKNKSIQLLKGVRQKLVKSEKDREELTERYEQLKASEFNAVENLKSEKAHFEKDAENMRLRIITLEGQLGSVTREKDALFEQVQIKLAEFESSQSALEALQSQTAEMSYQLREANDRCAALEDQIADNAKLWTDKANDREQVQELIRQQERASEGKINSIRSQLNEVQNERDSIERELANMRQSQSKEAESLRMQLLALEREHSDAARMQKKLTDEIETLRNDKSTIAKELSDVKQSLERAESKGRELEEAVSHARQSEESFLARNEQQNKIVKELKDKEIQLKTANKTLKDELRKAQGRSNDPRRSLDIRTSETQSPTPGNGSPVSVKSKKEGDTELEIVNFEYLRNVIFQFLEHKEMRPQLVQVLGIILKFTPQEIRRLTTISA